MPEFTRFKKKFLVLITFFDATQTLKVFFSLVINSSGKALKD
jgi:hypothetical protein